MIVLVLQPAHWHSVTDSDSDVGGDRARSSYAAHPAPPGPWVAQLLLTSPERSASDGASTQCQGGQCSLSPPVTFGPGLGLWWRHSGCIGCPRPNPLAACNLTSRAAAVVCDRGKQAAAPK